ncbi:MAG: 7-cyano-7-deazaguanine synthase [Deltaproteobacteria bacterium]|nr:7-cyano-7-deazaguanine synthase [Deltaproteobacteria bacterium]
MTKAVALLSGGLDSTLAVKLMLDQGIEVHALNFTSAFCTCNSGGVNKGGCRSESKRVADEFGIPIKVVTKGLDYIEVVRNPRHGYGKGMNPCVDCRVYMFRQARGYMEEIGASFIITGEVLGQRPMSQRKDAFRVIERESGLEGLILRPLCAKQLEPTIPENTGLVDRDKLLSMLGRSRRGQIDLAEELNINDYPCPSGGCLLTDKMFSKKVRDLLDHKLDVTKKDLLNLKTGRHFRYEGVKVILGRDEAENLKIRNAVEPGDTLLEPAGFPGPLALVNGEAGSGVIDFAAGLIVRYANEKAQGRRYVRAERDGVIREFEVFDAAGEADIEGARVC